MMPIITVEALKIAKSAYIKPNISFSFTVTTANNLKLWLRLAKQKICRKKESADIDKIAKI